MSNCADNYGLFVTLIVSNSYLNSPFGYRVGDACSNLKIGFGVGVELGLGLHPRSEKCLPFLHIPFQEKLRKK